MKIFVPGRICLFGEHSDWAGSYRRMNGDLGRGYTIITGTNQGIHAEVDPHPEKLIFHATLPARSAEGARRKSLEVPMEREALLAVAEEGGFFSYVAGVAYQILTHYRVRGLRIDNYSTDLPVKKGLSSSAAVCVLVARAFNRVYDLKMTVRGEMEFAYLGEITTPSRCGRMDQGCAYGDRPIMMIFDGERLDIRELSVSEDLFFVIVDLRAGKDTKEILSRLNRAYPFAENELHARVQEYLGPVNAEVVREAADALQRGDAGGVGELMRRAQAEFDSFLLPACPSQLTAPVLHKLLGYEPLKKYVLGGKGVGSQGDGAAQFIVRDEQSQQKAIDIIEQDLGMGCLKLVLRSGRRVRKAVIPAAGYGTRLFPATKAMKKELFPIVDASGRAKPVILAIIEEALGGGIEEVCVIVQEAEVGLFQEVFYNPPPIDYFNKLAKEDREYSGRLLEIGSRVTFVAQETQEGFGHAVYCARDWVGEEPFLLLLGDHLYASEDEVPCSAQILDAYERTGRSVVGLKVTRGADIHNFGCVTGTWQEPDSLLFITEFHEKPELGYARKYLHVDGMDEDSFLTVFGQYVLKPQVFDYLEEHIAHNVREKGEFQLTSCLDRLRQEDGFVGYVVRGRRFDIGLPEAYIRTVLEFSQATTTNTTEPAAGG